MIDFITSHWDTVLAVYGGLVAIATAIVKITPSTADDEVLGKIVSIVNWFSTANPKKKKD